MTTREALAEANEKLIVTKRLAKKLREEVARYHQWLGYSASSEWGRVAGAASLLTNLDIDKVEVDD